MTTAAPPTASAPYATAASVVAAPLPAWPRWSSERGFSVAGAAALIGIASPWQLPYVAAANGGGAFLLVYFAAVVLIAIPLLQAELVVGRRTRRAPAGAMAALARRERKHVAWQVPGWIGAAAALALLAVHGASVGQGAVRIVGSVGGDLAPAGGLMVMVAAQVAFLAAAALTASRGIEQVERAAGWIMRALLLALGGLIACAVVYGGSLLETVARFLQPNVNALGLTGTLLALKHACFTLGLGATVMVAYGAYLPESACIPRSSARIAAVGTTVPLVAGLVAMSFGAGWGFGAVTLTGESTGGVLAGAFLLILLLCAAYAAAVALLEPVIATLEQRFGTSRRRASACAAAVAGGLGMAPAMAAATAASANVLLIPLAAAGTALFAGRVVSRRVAREELAFCGGRYRFWWLMVRWAAPAAVAIAVLGLR